MFGPWGLFHIFLSFFLFYHFQSLTSRCRVSPSSYWWSGALTGTWRVSEHLQTLRKPRNLLIPSNPLAALAAENPRIEAFARSVDIAASAPAVAPDDGVRLPADLAHALTA